MKKIIILLIIMNLLAPIFSTIIFYNSNIYYDNLFFLRKNYDFDADNIIAYAFRNVIGNTLKMESSIDDNTLVLENEEFVFKPAYYDSSNNSLVISEIKTDKKTLYIENEYKINEQQQYYNWTNSKFYSEKRKLKVVSLLPTVYSDKVEELHIGSNIDVSHLDFNKSFPNLKKIVYDFSYDISGNNYNSNLDIYSFPCDSDYEHSKIRDFNLTKKDYDYIYGNVIILRRFSYPYKPGESLSKVHHAIYQVFDLDNESLSDIGFDEILYLDSKFENEFDMSTIINKNYYIDTNGDKIYKYEPLVLYIKHN